MNGALTIGTLDGANVEIREAVGPENFFLFGLSSDEVQARRGEVYQPWRHWDQNEELRRALDLLGGGLFSHGDKALFQDIVDNLLYQDPYLVLADFEIYMAAQEQVDDTWRDTDRCTRMSIVNAARMGRFSSDRCIEEYASTIWNVQAVPIEH